mgnify:CR=1 FL=1
MPNTISQHGNAAKLFIEGRLSDLYKKCGGPQKLFVFCPLGGEFVFFVKIKILKQPVRIAKKFFQLKKLK